MSLRSLLSAFVVACAALLFSSCSGTGGLSFLRTVPTEIQSVYDGDYFASPAVAIVDGKPALLYNTKDHHVAFWRDGKSRILDEGLPINGGQYLQLVVHGGSLYAMWWMHDPAKTVYFAVSNDGGKTFSMVQRIGNEHGILSPFTLAFGSGGVVGLLHDDERLPRYEVYLNRSLDNGLRWTDETRLDDAPVGADGQSKESEAIFPTLTQLSPTHWVAVWQDNEENSIVSRTTMDAGRTWAAPVVVYRDLLPLSSIALTRIGRDLLVVAQVGAQVGIKGFLSRDGGKTWHNVGVISGSEKISNAGIEIASSGDKATLVWNPFQPSGVKPYVLTASFDARSGKWMGAARRLDVKDSNTMSMSPHVIALANGTLVACWLDFRDIRPNVYLSASFDQGAAWTKPQDVQPQGKYSDMFPKLIADRNRVWLLYQYYKSDAHKDRRIVIQKLRLRPPAGFSDLPEPEHVDLNQRKHLLENRINEFWQARENKNYEKNYGIFDPAFRSMTSKKDFVDHQGNIVYHKFKLNSIEIKGNVATVKMDINYSTLPVTVLGYKAPARPPMDFEITNSWVWIYNNWFMVYKPTIGDQPLVY